MNKLMRLTLTMAVLLSAVLVMSFAVSAEEFTSGFYTYTVTDGKATITDVDSGISGDVTVPSKLGGYPVTSIDSWAFSRCAGLESITLSEKITSIGSYAFNACSKLDDIDLPDSVTTIGYNAFSSCTSLQSITIPEKVTTIADGLFRGCSSLKSVTLPDRVTNIGDDAFYGCTSLKKIEIPDRVMRIGSDAFYQCSSLESIMIPDRVSSIGYSTFYHCSSLKSISFPDGLTSIGSSSFLGCTSLKRLVLPDTLTSIGYDAFQDCTGLEYINIPENVSYIASEAFRNCSSLKSIKIPDKVSSIGQFTFAGCASLKSVSIGSGVYSISQNAFIGCDLSGGIEVSPDNRSFSSDQQGILYDKAKTEIVILPPNRKSVTIPDSVVKMPSGVFHDRTELERITIGSGITTIQPEMFYGCTSLKAIDIGAGVTLIDWDGFSGCEKLESITIPAGVKEFGRYVFTDCKKMKSIVFRGDAPVIDKGAFTDLTATAYYPAGNETWTADKRRDYGGDITWVAAEFPLIVTQPKTVTVRQGSNAKVTVGAVGDGLNYRWYVKGVGASKYTKSSCTDATYSAWMRESVKDRVAYCVVTDQYGNSVRSKTVRLRMAATVTKQPMSVTVAKGETAKVSVNAVGDGLTYTWYYKNSGDDSYTKSSVTGASYSVTMSAARHGRRLYCVVTDKYGNKVKTDTVRLSIEATVTKKPVSVTVAKGATAKVSVKAVGDGLTYTWYYKNVGDEGYSKSSVTTSTYSVKMSAARSGRRVYCVVTDKYGNRIRTNSVVLKMK